MVYCLFAVGTDKEVPRNSRQVPIEVLLLAVYSFCGYCLITRQEATMSSVV